MRAAATGARAPGSEYARLVRAGMRGTGNMGMRAGLQKTRNVGLAGNCILAITRQEEASAGGMGSALQRAAEELICSALGIWRVAII